MGILLAGSIMSHYNEYLASRYTEQRVQLHSTVLHSISQTDSAQLSLLHLSLHRTLRVAWLTNGLPESIQSDYDLIPSQVTTRPVNNVVPHGMKRFQKIMNKCDRLKDKTK